MSALETPAAIEPDGLGLIGPECLAQCHGSLLGAIVEQEWAREACSSQLDSWPCPKVPVRIEGKSVRLTRFRPGSSLTRPIFPNPT